MRHLIYFVFLGIFTLSAHADSRVKKSAHGFWFINAGISQEEIETIKLKSKHYNLHLIFSEGEEGQLATPVNVDIYNQHSRQMFRLENAEPHLLIKLPYGQYSILANYMGQRQRYSVTLGKKYRKVILNWKTETAL